MITKKVANIIGVLLLVIMLFYLVTGKLLSYNKPIPSPYVLIEDWISPPVMEIASTYIVENNIDSVFIVGILKTNASYSAPEFDKTKKLKKNSSNTYDFYRGGILGFEIPDDKLKDTFTLKVRMHGTSYAKIFPYYRIYFNKQLISSGFVNEQDSVYQFVVSKKATDSLACIFINFDNDISDSNEDRNLYISGIYIDSVEIDSIISDNFFFSYAEKPAIYFVSQLNNIKYYLGDRGYDTLKVRFIEVNNESINKTLALAKGAKKYFSNTEVKNINIITTRKHSGRSYINFSNSLGKSMEVGCIPVSSIIDKETSFLAEMDERVSLLLSWIYWWFH